MGKFFATTIFIGCIFFIGMYFGATMTESNSINNSESFFSAYEKWKLEQQKIDGQLMNEPVLEEDGERNNLFSTLAKSCSDALKNLLRMIVFRVLAIFETIFDF